MEMENRQQSMHRAKRCIYMRGWGCLAFLWMSAFIFTAAGAYLDTAPVFSLSSSGGGGRERESGAMSGRASTVTAELNLLPLPAAVEQVAGRFSLNAETVVVADPMFTNEAALLAN